MPPAPPSPNRIPFITASFTEFCVLLVDETDIILPTLLADGVRLVLVRDPGAKVCERRLAEVAPAPAPGGGP
eukprot:CAMPEP_0179002244 /NCGR_PEP_ID=MMETSP0795-20121207/11876_1 /TAXON_ID=88552 /ORGANISM="Amoebophrya sp., Strain Ameob2" /LENGTH=71 /DNA_ID=CAMNT_0020695843 /DNA_START=862 /DNA_END=1074 /DNA_ORIENTATION=+